jgi:IstB-like ATP binding protein
MTRQPIPLAADLEAGLKRLKLSTIRREAPDVLATAKAQRWPPEEVLRNLVDAEITSRDASNTRTRMAAARFPVDKTLAEFNVTESSIPPASHDYLVTLEWIHQAVNLCMVGPAGTSSVSAKPPSTPDTKPATSPPLISSSTSTALSRTTPLAKPSSRSAGTISSSLTKSDSHPSITPAANSSSGSSQPATNADP